MENFFFFNCVIWDFFWFYIGFCGLTTSPSAWFSNMYLHILLHQQNPIFKIVGFHLFFDARSGAICASVGRHLGSHLRGNPRRVPHHARRPGLPDTFYINTYPSPLRTARLGPPLLRFQMRIKICFFYLTIWARFGGSKEESRMVWCYSEKVRNG